MKALSNKVTDWLTGRDLKTVLNPVTTMKDEVTLSTDKYFHVHSYILPFEKIIFTDEKAILAKLPKKSNISDIAPKMDKVRKRLKGDKLKSSNDEHSKVMWVDNFNRSFASNIETPDRVLFNIRGDIANDLFLEGYALIQCTTVSCSIFIPTKISVDMKLFTMKDPINGSGFK